MEKLLRRFCVFTQKSFVELCWVFKNQWLCVVDRGDGEGGQYVKAHRTIRLLS